VRTDLASEKRTRNALMITPLRPEIVAEKTVMAGVSSVGIYLIPSSPSRSGHRLHAGE